MLRNTISDRSVADDVLLENLPVFRNKCVANFHCNVVITVLRARNENNFEVICIK